MGNMDVWVHDPVCQREFEIHYAAGLTDYEGTTYFFCSTECRQTFAAFPERRFRVDETFEHDGLPGLRR